MAAKKMPAKKAAPARKTVAKKAAPAKKAMPRNKDVEGDDRKAGEQARSRASKLGRPIGKTTVEKGYFNTFGKSPNELAIATDVEIGQGRIIRVFEQKEKRRFLPDKRKTTLYAMPSMGGRTSPLKKK